MADLDGNGTQDMLSGSWPGEIYFFRRKPNGMFAAGDKLRDKSGKFINVGKASAVAVADWDSDGDLDLVIGNIDGRVLLVRNGGTKEKAVFGGGETLKAGPADIVAPNGDAGPCVADWDGDGRLDLLMGSGSGEVKFYRNIGTANAPKLASGEVLVTAAPERGKDGRTADFDNPSRPGMRSKVCVADWNGDGRADLFVGDFHSSGQARTYHGWVWVYPRRAPAQASE